MKTKLRKKKEARWKLRQSPRRTRSFEIDPRWSVCWMGQIRTPMSGTTLKIHTS